MAIGVPKVPYDPSFEDPDNNSNREERVPLYDALRQVGTLLLFSELSDAITADLTGQIIALGLDENIKEIELYINSPGGSVKNGLAIYDAMQASKLPVRTICVGQALGMASLILAGGAYGKRQAFTHSTIMTPGFKTIMTQSEDMPDLRTNVEAIFALRTGISPELSDRFMTAIEAKEFGIVDVIGVD
uniref:ATP-dependent Clp protease proteolytic subunit n=1 Tax=Cyphia banksiana TaxID=2041113 RepID=A0A291F2S5_9ASTR|nr:hypothetical protein Cyp_ban1Pt0615 [Cyphia banksiana]ATG26417.1 hypothetical protein Cyp_ban1Pt0615 [Cyphia banksiana]